MSFFAQDSLHIRTAAAVLAIGWATAAPAFGQSNDEDAASAKFRLGPLAVKPSVALTNLGIDTNVFNESDDPRRDVTASVEPRVETWLRLGRARLSSRSHGEFVYFQQYEGERSLNSDHQARLELLFNRIKPFAEASFLSSRQRPGYEIDARAQRQETGAKAGARIRLAGETWLELTAHRSRVSFDPEAEFLGTNLREVLNRDVDRASAGIRYPLTPLTTIVLLADTQRDRFALSPIRDSKSLRIIPGIEFDSRALISGRAYVGYHRFDALGTGVPGYRGVYASVDLAYAMLGSTKFSARAERDVNYSFEILQPYYLLTGVSGSVSQVIVRPWDLKMTWGRQQLDYRYGTLDNTAGRVDHVQRYGAGLGYRISPDTRVGVDLDYYRRESAAAGRQYDSLRAGTSVTYGF
jgi:hypothetical protein